VYRVLLAILALGGGLGGGTRVLVDVGDFSSSLLEEQLSLLSLRGQYLGAIARVYHLNPQGVVGGLVDRVDARAGRSGSLLGRLLLRVDSDQYARTSNTEESVSLEVLAEVPRTVRYAHFVMLAFYLQGAKKHI
jgi:hypothetical protein